MFYLCSQYASIRNQAVVIENDLQIQAFVLSANKPSFCWNRQLTSMICMPIKDSCANPVLFMSACCVKVPANIFFLTWAVAEVFSAGLKRAIHRAERDERSQAWSHTHAPAGFYTSFG